MTPGRQAAPVFTAGAFRCFEMTAADLPGLQRFFEASPEYHFAVTGEAPEANAAQQAFELLLPAEWPFEKRWLLRFADLDGSMIAMADVIAGLFVEDVWHIGLFVVATRLHGDGVAQRLYGGLESWMRDAGAGWLRLGVVEGNERAERFWQGRGYIDVRKRFGVNMGQRVNTLCVMVKPLAGGSMSEYLALVERDRPE